MTSPKLKVWYQYRWDERRWRVKGVLRAGDLERRRFNQQLPAGLPGLNQPGLLTMIDQGGRQRAAIEAEYQRQWPYLHAMGINHNPFGIGGIFG